MALAILSWLTAGFLFATATGSAQIDSNPRVDAVRFWSFGDVTRVAVETAGPYRFTSDQLDNPARILFDLNGLKPPSTVQHGMQTILVGDHRVKQIRIAEVVPGTTRVVLDILAPVEVSSSQLVNPDRLIIEIRPKGAQPASIANITHSLTGAQRVNLSLPGGDSSDRPTAAIQPAITQAAKTTAPPPVVAPPIPNPVNPAPISTADLRKPAKPPLIQPDPPTLPATGDSDGDPSLVRVFGLKLGRVVIDAGHGGKDGGTVGSDGLLEKDLVLDVALRLGKLIHQQLGTEVIYTRSDDTFIPLNERTAIANRVKSDLFISIHANSSPDSTSTGVETYYFNLHADKKALDVAMRENAAADNQISDLNDLLHKAVLQTKLEESREFAQKVQESLAANSIKMNNKAHDRGVRKAPFVVLIGASMPSILAEIGFVSNPHDEKLLRRPDQREKIAQALLRGVTEYANTLSHSQIAKTGL